MLLQRIGARIAWDSRVLALGGLRDLLLKLHAAGGQCLVVVDESHKFSNKGLEAIRLLNNLEQGASKLVQVLMLGQEELTGMLTGPGHDEAFRQRIANMEILGRMKLAQVRNYVRHRLRMGGAPRRSSRTWSSTPSPRRRRESRGSSTLSATGDCATPSTSFSGASRPVSRRCRRWHPLLVPLTLLAGGVATLAASLFCYCSRATALYGENCLARRSTISGRVEHHAVAVQHDEFQIGHVPSPTRRTTVSLQAPAAIIGCRSRTRKGGDKASPVVASTQPSMIDLRCFGEVFSLTATTAPAAPPAPSAPSPVAADDTKTAPPQPILFPAANKSSQEDALLLLARKSELTDDLKTAKAIYLRLSREGNYRDLAAQRLGDLHFAGGEYRQAEEVYRESARLLRAGSVPAQKPLLP